MSLKAMTWAWQMPVKGNQKLILLALADHADDTGKCWPGIEGLAEKCGLSRSAATEHIQVLIKLDIITSQKRHDENGYRRSSLYVLNFGLSPESLHRNSLRRKSQHRKNQRRDLPAQSPDSGESKVQNLDGNNINHQQATVIEPSHIAQSPLDAQKENAQIIKINFEIFWQAYRKHKDRARAFKTFSKIKPDAELLHKMLDAIENQHTERIYQQRYTGWAADWKHPATWLNGENWNDEVNLDENYWRNSKRKSGQKTESLVERSRRERAERRGEATPNCYLDSITVEPNKQLTGERD